MKKELRPLIVRTARMLTDCMDAKCGLVKMDDSRPEYWLLDELLTDDMARIALKMGVRKPTTPDVLAGKLGWEEAKVRNLLDEMAEIGIVEYNWRNSDRHKQYELPIFVVGSCESLMMSEKMTAEHPRIPEFFEKMSRMPLEPIVGMVPPGGAGLSFHTIPVEKSIPHRSEAVDIEKLSFWLDKYRDQLAIEPCGCRKARILLGEGTGEMYEDSCIAVGDYADYLVQTGRGRKADFEQVIALLQRCEDNGYMHQITNGYGRDEIFGICNCTAGNCFALRCSQLFNAPNMSASCYRASVDSRKCVACGKCSEVCPAGAVRLGQKLNTKEGPVVYPKQKIATGAIGWSKENWNPNYRNDNRKNCYPGGTSPCKAACPAHVSIQAVMKFVQDGHYLPALKLLRMDNPFPSLCSKCAHPCENACTRGHIDYPMAISSAMKMLAEKQEEYKDSLIPKKIRLNGSGKDYEQKIAVKGGGADSLSCAYFLAANGYPVTVFAEGVCCSESEKYIMQQLGVIFKAGLPEPSDFAAVYPDCFGAEADNPAGLVEGGREAAVSLHRSIHGHSMTMARNPRDFIPMDVDNVVIPPSSIREHTCLECGIAHVDENRCIGCGICTTRCITGAIKIERSHPEFENYVPYEKAKINTVINGVKKTVVSVIKVPEHGGKK